MKQRFKGFLALVLMLALLSSLALASTAEETKKKYCYEEDPYSENIPLVSGTTVVYPGDEIHTAYSSGGKIFAIADKKENGKPIAADFGEGSMDSPIFDAEGNEIESIYALTPYGGLYTVPALETGYKGYITYLGIFNNYFQEGYNPEDEDTIKEYYKLNYLYLEPIPVVYAVSFDANGGTGTVENMTLSYGEEKALPENSLTREGYTFAGWNTKADGSGTAFADKATVKNLTTSETEAFLLFAQWTEIVSSDTENENPSNTTDSGTHSDSDITDSTVSDTSASDVSDVTDSDVTDTATSENGTTDNITDNTTDLSSETSGTSSDKTTDSAANGTGSGNGEVEEDSSVLWIILIVALLVIAAVVGTYLYFKKRKPEGNE